MPKSTCPACGAEAGEAFFRVESAPTLCHRLCRTHHEALEQPRGAIELALCGSCGLVYNQAFDPGLIQYDGEYENALHYSGVFREYAEGLARDLVERHEVRGKTVAEIGCGDGQFLEALCRAGGNRGLGFDPAYSADRHGTPGDGRIRIVPKLFDVDSMERIDLGLVCCRQVLEHIDEPSAFVRRLRSSLGHRSIPVFFEVPSALHTLERRGFWDVIYEHVTYFTPPALRMLFERAGFEVLRLAELYAGQFLVIEARLGATEQNAITRHAELEEFRRLAGSFAQQFAELRSEWRERLKELRREGRPVVIWGAGSKTVMFLNHLSAGAKEIACVVDRNPRKHGCFVVGTGQEIISPAQLKDLAPDVVILLNPAYEKEVREDLAALAPRAALESVA
ncbi:MAG: methyltransferase domain-containing protein [Gammaproteobacteria bacterium]|nr:methyltransferase domain-containing protein [Gammaproteobacteria bacterium]NIR90094.1 methyltransferase domain-containing protein [Gammaproteobacteria bacterium]NIU03299.1 methyltransferase domain-containing protein [Gammaproteobacteria bacterium]NIV50793.1 methyltransferase domain-containing protein [Gammaproteobacteria bacterium]NIV75378.1 methyltransferase domain-containing protein [Gammaproteobacteria bacterium]